MDLNINLSLYQPQVIVAAATFQLMFLLSEEPGLEMMEPCLPPSQASKLEEMPLRSEWSLRTVDFSTGYLCGEEHNAYALIHLHGLNHHDDNTRWGVETLRDKPHTHCQVYREKKEQGRIEWYQSELLELPVLFNTVQTLGFIENSAKIAWGKIAVVGKCPSVDWLMIAYCQMKVVRRAREEWRATEAKEAGL